jgi:hypothetical protein
MKKHVAQSLARNRDENPVLGIAQQRLGLKFSKIEIEKKYKGSSTYTLNSRFKLFIRIFRAIPKSYSKFATWIGIAGMGCFILAFIWFMACGFFSNDSLPGESLLVPIIILVSGIGIFLLSIVTKLLVNRKNSIYEFSEVVIKDSYDIS